ncbi:presenilin family intramembrane aspartyl protease PSH [Halohasta litorea]|uniref:Presenilin family intramembrane aspartyl protease PSH n=1 Tax=Halohasta litorea TaxID=869891 RepID=A0ABD6D5P5_9EURY|nr:presenilin family intramembrane aspartyl protease PSH [Halohasta litorea]
MFPREYRGVAGAVLLFLLIQLGSLALVQTFFEQGYQAVENPDDPTNSLLYIGAILLATLGFLAAFKYDLDWIVRVVIVATSGLLAWYVFSALFPMVVAVALGSAVAIALWVYPEWYVVDTAGVLMGAGAAGLFGITFGILPALVLLSVLAIYDAISVYKTEHMLDLADGVMDLRIPAILVIPLSLSYSLLDEEAEMSEDEASTEGDDADEATDDDDRDVFFIGLGDAVIPGVLIASAAFFSPAPQFAVPIIELNLPALLALVGTLGGLLVLMRMVMKGRAHAGLPLLNGGAIAGYILGSLLAGISMLETVGLTGII